MKSYNEEKLDFTLQDKNNKLIGGLVNYASSF